MSDPAREQPINLRAELESLKIDRGAIPAAPVRRRSRRRFVVPAVIVLAVAGVIAVRAVRQQPRPVVVAAITRTDPAKDTTVPVLSGSGYVVTADRYVSIGVRVPGRIERYFVEEGQSVHKGDSLVEIDDRDYRSTVARAQAALAMARANLGLAQAELARARQLRAKDFQSQQELDVSENKAKVAAATVAQAEAELEQAKVNLEYTVLRAPSDGVILAKLKEVGEIAVPGGFAGSGDLIRLANLTEIRAEVDVNEADLNRIRLGQPAEVIPDAYPDARYEAHVVKFYPQVDRQKGTLKVEVRVLKPDRKLLPDMSARITFLEPLPPEQARSAALLVPLTAVRTGPDGSHVWVVDGGRVRRVAIQTASGVGDRVRVLKGLSGDETVVVSDDQGLSDGSAVTVTK